MKNSSPCGSGLLAFLSGLDDHLLARLLFGFAQELARHQSNHQPTPSSHTMTAESALAVNLYGGADAFGMNTYSSADVDILVVDRGLAQCASGSATFVAAAEDTDQGSPFASAYAELEIIGADFSTLTESHASYSDDTKAVDTASVQFAAIDLVFDWTGRGCGKDDLFHGSGNDDPSCDDHGPTAPGIGQLDGNLAEFQVTSTAYGENTLVEVSTDAIAVQDSLSSVVVAVTAAVDRSIAYTEIDGTSRDDRITMGTGLGLAHGNGGDDRITGGAADDWIFGDQGDDNLSGGGGDDTMFGGTQSDQISGGAGEDWIFGGRGSDKLDGGSDDDLIFGHEDDDQIDGGGGNDIINGGKGSDRMFGGAGDDWFLLGADHGDDNDIYSGGAGADHYLIQDEFDRDVISDFKISDGDRLAISFSADQPEDLSIGMQRGGKDLIITFSGHFVHDQLTLTNFFGLNPEIQDMPRSGSLSHTQVAALLQIITDSSEATADLQHADQMLTIGDMLSSIG
jgi:Ca2+-binding RTX toxin-like protein